MPDYRTKTITLKPIKLLVNKKNDFAWGLKRKRDITLREARHILKNILGINILMREDCVDADEYKYYNEDLLNDVTDWLDGKSDDNVIMEYTYVSDELTFGIFNIVKMIDYLQKKEII